MKRFQGKYRIPSARLPGHDYGAPGWYFVTICTKDRRCHLGDVVDGAMRRSAVGQRAHENWQAIPEYFDHVRLDTFVVMPNHVHGLIGLRPRDAGGDGNDGDDGDENAVETCHWRVSTTERDEPPKPQKNQAMSAITPDAGSLGVIINQYKGAVTRWARKHGPADFGWQSRFYDRVVRNQKERFRIRRYIEENPAKWQRDRNHPNRT